MTHMLSTNDINDTKDSSSNFPWVAKSAKLEDEIVRKHSHGNVISIQYY